MRLKEIDSDLEYPKEVAPIGNPKLLVFVGNPTQYHSPIFRKLSDELGGKLQIMYGDDIGARPFFNPEVNSIVEWDIPLLEGFPYKIFKNLTSSKRKGFWSRINLALLGHVYKSPASHVLIHGYDTLSSIFVYLAAIFSGKKIIWRGETVFKPGKQVNFNERLKRLILPIYFRGVDTVLWSCLNNRDCLATYIKGQQDKLLRFPCAVDNDFFVKQTLDAKESQKMREKYGIRNNQLVITTCSRLTDRKRTYLILDAVAKMQSKDVVVLIIGDGPARASLQERATELNIDVKITGFVGQLEVAKLLSISNIFCLLSYYDASPKALNEAMNFPVGMIVSKGVGTARDLVIPKKNGFIFDTGMEDFLIDWLDGWAMNRASLKRAGEENKLILMGYTIEEGVNNLIKVVNDIGV